jgi:outer membrane protein assembly complex protein YaeT
MKKFFYIFIFFTLLFSSTGYSNSWSTEGISIPPIVEEDLRKTFPTIENEDDIAELIERFSSYYPSAKIEPIFDGISWKIKISKNLIIASITARAITNSLSRNIEKATREFRGKVYTKENLNNMKQRALNAMNDRGFPNALILVTTEISENRVEIRLNIKNGKKCIIRKVVFPFKLPDVDIPTIDGKICNISKIISFTDEVEKSIRKANYAFAHISFLKIVRTNSNTHGTVHLQGKLGSKVKYEFENTGSRSRLLDISNTFRTKLTPEDYSPYSVKSEIIKQIRKEGFNAVKVEEPKITKNSDGENVYLFKFDPGEETKITNITVIGSNVFSKEQVLDLLKTSMTWGVADSIDFDELDAGITVLKNAYIEKGYWDIKVREPRFTTDPSTGNTTIVLLIEEGLPRVLSEIEIKGNNFVSKATISKMFPTKLRKAIDRNRLIAFEKELKDFYYESGFIYVDVDIKLSSFSTRRSRPSKVTVSINEGPLAKFGEIFVFGLIKTHKDVVLREINFQSGETYSPTKIIEAKRKLISTGVFRSVNVEPMDKLVLREKGQIIDISIVIKEAEAGLISFGPGYDVFKGYNYTVEASYKNLQGMGRKISIRGFFSQDKEQEAVKSSTLLGTVVGLGYSEPYFLNLPVDGRLSLSHKAKATNFWKFSTISREEISYSLDDSRQSYATIYAKQKINVEVGSDDQTALFLTQGDTHINSAGVQLHLDLRNDIRWPSGGSYLSIDVEKAGYYLDGNVKFDKIGITNNNYLSIGKSLVFALGIQYTKYSSIDRNNSEYGLNTIPTSEALFAGGSDMVRGYNKQLGPYIRYFSEDEDGNETIKQGEIIGGTTRFIGKLEMRYLLSENSAITLFYDSGNSFLDQSELEKLNYRLANQTETIAPPTLEDNFVLNFEESLKDPDKYLSNVYTSTGISYNFLTPLGSFRFGYAFPIKQPVSDSCSRFLDYCLERRPTGDQLIDKGKIDISIAATF